MSIEKGLQDVKVKGVEEHVRNLQAQNEEKEVTIEKLTNQMENQRTNFINKDKDLISANDKISDLENKISDLENKLINKTQEAFTASTVQEIKLK